LAIGVAADCVDVATVIGAVVALVDAAEEVAVCVGDGEVAADAFAPLVLFSLSDVLTKSSGDLRFERAGVAIASTLTRARAAAWEERDLRFTFSG
jgi:hypothetical protein